MKDDNLTYDEERNLLINLIASSALASISKDIFLAGEEYTTVVEVISTMLVESLDSASDLTEEALKPLKESKDLPTTTIYAARINNIILTAEKISKDKPTKVNSRKSSSNILKLH